MSLDLNSKAHWIDGMSNEIYHADKNSYSSSQLKTIVTRSPLAFKTSIDSTKPKVETDAMRIGTLVHHAILEGPDFIRRYVVMPSFAEYGHGNSTAHKKAKAEWLEEHQGRIILSHDEFARVEGIVESVNRNSEAVALLKGNRFERSGFYKDPETGIPLRIRYDSYDERFGILTDVKTVQSVRSREFSKSILNYRWDFSLAMYAEGIKAIDGRSPDTLVFLAIEKEPPYELAIYPLSQRAWAIGRDDYRLSLEILRDCRRSGHWPSYDPKIDEIDLPYYFEGMRNV